LYWDLVDFFDGRVPVEVREVASDCLGCLGGFVGPVKAVDVGVNRFSGVGLIDAQDTGSGSSRFGGCRTSVDARGSRGGSRAVPDAG
jgi:hypothetical protein